MTVLLTAKDVAVTAGDTLLKPASLVLHKGRPFTILGETGSGKSLLAQAIMGTLPKGLCASGSVTIGDRILDLSQDGNHRSLWGTVIGVLPQEPWMALDPTMRAVRQVEEGYLYVRGADRDTARRSANTDLAEIALETASEKLPSQLSGGMAQRVAFAAARAGGAAIIIADEPTKGLDVARRDDVIALLAKEVASGGGLLTITHDLELARRLGGDVAIMLEGKVIEQGAAEAVFRAPSHEYTRRLIAADPASWPMREKTAPAGRSILVAEGLAKRRGGQQLFKGRDFAVGAGEIVGITGPSGCGKSTFGDILLGLLQPDEGIVSRSPDFAPIRFQKLYQDPPSAFPQRVTLRCALDDLVALHRLDEKRIAPLLHRLRLPASLLDRLPSEVSGGELQRLALLRVLLLDPVFLFADEPTSRLDLITQRETIELLIEIAKESGCALLIVSHDAELIEKTSDRSIAFTL
ncbi:peptide/nickel transport system ATP-binding protein [Rhodoligotrophos appendicifer]|uniref:ABC transporter ATP-binding protein n=1 Tax=Rhodoligotrophos appendicifer TaxID=987056 RepID=UPI00117BFC15|nr:ATP-binding cassette domain-containing protein [Rhodoligotrophos appendicifer]